ncbi:MAG: polysaccharide export protein [Robiginitomaculum sp.]|nr:polysaccharide export protein [Robiginitomaculum sp.]
MQKIGKNGVFMGVMAISLLLLAGCGANSNMHPYTKTNQLGAQNTAGINQAAHRNARRYGNQNAYGSPKLRAPKPEARRYGGRYGTAAPLSVARPGPDDMFQRWIDYEPQYKLYPGDQLDVIVESAPELSRTLTVAPDGRITMPMASGIMAAGKTLPWIEQALRAELSKQLRDPTVAITSRAFAPQNIYVGGQVGQQGTYTLSGPIGSLEAIIMAGGFLPSAKTREVAVLRRAPNGGLMMRVINHKSGLKSGMRNIRSYADNMQLRRGDIIFVPRSSLSEVGVFVQQIRDALPIDIGVSYNLGDSFRAN